MSFARSNVINEWFLFCSSDQIQLKDVLVRGERERGRKE